MGRFNFKQHTEDNYEVSPSQAKKWLEQNKANRSVNKAKVKQMARDIKEGHWDSTHQGIAIASDGTLIDGQHRLLAIVEAGKSVKINVTFNATKSSHIDSGTIRTMSNRLQMGEEGIPWVNQSITAAARVIGVMFPKLNLKNEETLHDWLSRYKTEIETAFKYVRKVPITNLNSAGITAALVTATINGVPEIYIKGFMEVLYSSFAKSPADVYAINLRDELQKYKKGQTAGSGIQRYAYTRTCNRINQYYMSATGQRVAKRIVDGAFPYDIPDKDGKMIYRKGKLQTQ